MSTVVPQSTFSRSDLTLYLIETRGGSDAGVESRLALGREEADRVAQDLAAGHADVVTVDPLQWDSQRELDALFMADDVDGVLSDVFAFADGLGLDYEPGRCDAYALLVGVRSRLSA